MTKKDDNSEYSTPTGENEHGAEGFLNVRRRDVMKAAGAAGVISGGFAGVGTAQEGDGNDCSDPSVSGPCDDCSDTGCDATSGSCTSCLTEGCTEIPDTRLEAGPDFSDGLYCLEVDAGDIPDTASKAVIKAANDCHECVIIDPTQSQTFCIDGQNAISHIEFAECPDAEITVDCPNDRARVDVELTDSYYFEVSYTDCDPESELDEPLSGTRDFDPDADGGTGDDWHDFVALADCEGTITVWNSSSKDVQFDSVQFDCESGTVKADCEADEITVFAEDTTDLWYEVDYDNCDAPDVGRTMVSGLDSADTVTIVSPIPNCAGTVTLYEDEGSTTPLDSDTFDCATADVSVACELDALGDATATIESDNLETVWYQIDYDNCDEPDVTESNRGSVDLSGSKTSESFPIAECDGTISVWDAATGGRMLDSATIDCADAEVSVVCDVDTTGDAKATIKAPDTDPVWYDITYENCEDDNVVRKRLDLDGATDEVTFPIAECDGKITVWDAASEGTKIAETTFNCADADVSVECELSSLDDATATITAPNLDKVWYTTTYTNCDDGEAVTLEEADIDPTTDTATVDIAECDGSIEVYDAASGGDLIASADIDCADADVSVACTVDVFDDATATIEAPDADTVWYTTTYENCGDSGVTRELVDLSGSDSAQVDLAECDGSIEVYDAASGGDLIASADIDCADADVSVDCELDALGDATATVEAPDLETVWYEIDYDNCDEPDVTESNRGSVDLSGSKTTESFPIAECDGTIRVYDAVSGGDLLGSAEIDCADATVDVTCELDTLDDAKAVIEAPDTDMVWYSVEYEANCEADDVPRTKVELTGSTDEVEVDLAECSGTIRVFDAAEGGTEIADSTFNCGDADVTVECAFGPDAVLEDAKAVITAPDLDTVWYTTSYVNCDESGVDRQMVDLSTSNSVEVDLADCDGTIEVWDAASGGDLIASADIDCADADVSVDCVNEVATIVAPDTDVVEYEIVYGDCVDEDVPRTEITLGADDEATVSVADCAGTINVYDVNDGDLLASANFDCVPTVSALSADCEKTTVDFGALDYIAGDTVRVDVDVKDSTGASLTSLSSGSVTMSSGSGGGNVSVNDTDGDGVFEQVVYTYSNEVATGTSWQTVDVSVFLVDQNRFLDLDPGTSGVQETATFDVGPCGCPDCPENDLEVKFEDPGISVCDTKDGFVITDVTRDSQGELQSVCFATLPERPVYCELGVCVKAGPETEQVPVEPTTTTFDETQCDFDVNGDGDVTANATIQEYCVSSINDKAISHITIVCPGVTCPENEGPGGGPNR